MSVRSRLFALTYDRMSAGGERAGLAELRQGLLEGATGRVVEIGAGTGANLAWYGSAIESLTVTEPEPPMIRRLEKKVRDAGSPAGVLRAPAGGLPVGDGSF